MRLLLVATMFVGPAPLALAQLGSPPVPPGNPITDAKRILGKALFWDEQLFERRVDGVWDVSHPESAGGGDPRSGQAVHPGPDGLFGTPDDKLGSPGVVHANAADQFDPDPTFGLDVQITGRLANSTLTAAYFDELFWDGRASSTFIDPETGAVSLPSGGALESQSVGPIVSSVEMAHAGRTWDQVRDKLESADPLALAWNLPADLATALASEPSYPELFADAFGDPAITAERIGFVLATYQRTLVPDQAPWDLFQAGQQNALTPQQQQGLNQFNSPGHNCNVCHAPPLFSNGEFRNVGLRPIQEDIGRQEVTGLFADRGKFKVPSLRNVALRGRFFHTGSPNIDTLAAAVAFYDNGGGPFNNNEDPLVQNIQLAPFEINAIASFLTALTDPRVAAELPPFDRPLLNSERPVPNPELLGAENAGSGGVVPELILTSPPKLGNRDFKIGVRNALGGAPSFVGLSLSPPTPMGLRGVVVRSATIPLAVTGPGDGFGTWGRALPDRPTLAGLSVYFQWFVPDPAAVGGVARSQVARLLLF